MIRWAVFTRRAWWIFGPRGLGVSKRFSVARELASGGPTWL